MGFEVRLTDIRGEPPLQVGEFMIDKDNNILYVGKGDYSLSKNGGAEIGIMCRFIPIPPKRAFVNIEDKGNVKIGVIARVIPVPSYKFTVNVQDNSIVNIGVSGRFSKLKKISTSVNIKDESNINVEGSGNIVT